MGGKKRASKKRQSCRIPPGVKVVDEKARSLAWRFGFSLDLERLRESFLLAREAEWKWE